MRPLALDLIERIHDGHAHRCFHLPVVEFVRLFAPDASAQELSVTEARGSLEFVADTANGGTFHLPPGEPALFDLNRESLLLRIPERMSGRYEIYTGGFLVAFNDGEELEGCKRLLLLVCNRLASVEVSRERIHARAVRSRMFDLLVEFD